MQAPQPSAQQRCDLRPFQRCSAQRGRPRGPHIDLLVRSRLVLVHSAQRRRHQRRRSGVALLPQEPHASDQRLLPRYHRPVSATGRAPQRRPTHRSGRGHRQLLLSLYSLARPQLPAARRCLRVHRSGVLLGRDAGDEERLCRGRGDRGVPARTLACQRGAARVRPPHAPRSKAILLVHLSRDLTDDARDVHGPAQYAAYERGAAVAAGRRYLRQHADLALAAGIQTGLWLAVDAASAPQRTRAPPAPPQYPARRVRTDARQLMGAPAKLPLDSPRLADIRPHPATWWRDVLAVVCYARDGDALASPLPDMPAAHVMLPVLAGLDGTVEVWRLAGPMQSGRHGRVQYRRNERMLFAALSIAEQKFAAPQSARSATALRGATRAVYRQLFDALSALGFPHPLRIWNVLPEINGQTREGERYWHFNDARQEAFIGVRRDIADNVPAASALGSPHAGPLTVYCIASARAPITLENPRQRSAWDYPAQYGPKSPTF